MSWITLRVDIRTDDEHADTPGRIEREALRALESRFGNVTIERFQPQPRDVDGVLDRLEATRRE